jgi:hypothetical protein
MEHSMDTPIKLVDYRQVDECVGQVIETLQVTPELADSLFMVLCDWLEENDYEITNEN